LFLGDDWVTVVVVNVVPGDSWVLGVVGHVLVSVHLVDEVEVTVLSGETVVDGLSGEGDDGTVDDITTEDDLTENSVEVDLSEEDGLVDLLGDEVETEELLQKENILLGDGGNLVDVDETVDEEVDEVSGESTTLENLTEDGDKVNLSDENGLVDLLGDDLVLEEVLEENNVALGEDDGGGLEWDHGGVDHSTTDDHLTEDGEEVNLADEDGLVDLWGDDLLTEELLDQEDVLLGDNCEGRVDHDETVDDEVDELEGESTTLENLTEDHGEVNLSDEDSLVDFLGDDLVLEEVLEENNVALGEDYGGGGVNWDDGVDDITADDHLTEEGEQVNLSNEDGLVDLWGDDLLTEELLDQEDVLFGEDDRVDEDETVDDEVDELDGESTTFENLTEEDGEVDLAEENLLVDFLGDDLLLEEILEDDDVAFSQDDAGVGDFWDDGGVDNLETADDDLEEISADSATGDHLTEDGGVVDLSEEDGLVDVLGDDLLLEELLEEEDIALGDGNGGDDELVSDWNDGVDNWEDLGVNLDIDNLGFVNNNLVGDWLNNDLLAWDKLDISLDFLSDDSLVELVQEELVVGLLGSLEWVGGGCWDVETLVVVGVRKEVLVLEENIIDQGLESEDILMLAIDGGKVVLSVEQLDDGVDVLVEEDGVDKVLLVGGQLVEALEVHGGDEPLEAWVLDVLAEEGQTQVLLEELGGVELLEGEDTVYVNDIVDVVECLVLDGGVDGGDHGGVQNLLLLSDNKVLFQLLLQQQIVISQLGDQRGGLLLVDQAKGLQIQAAGSYGGDESHEDKSFHGVL
jgi:hypothetical protein